MKTNLLTINWIFSFSGNSILEILSVKSFADWPKRWEVFLINTHHAIKIIFIPIFYFEIKHTVLLQAKIFWYTNETKNTKTKYIIIIICYERMIENLMHIIKTLFFTINSYNISNICEYFNINMLLVLLTMCRFNISRKHLHKYPY